MISLSLVSNGTSFHTLYILRITLCVSLKSIRKIYVRLDAGFQLFIPPH